MIMVHSKEEWGRLLCDSNLYNLFTWDKHPLYGIPGLDWAYLSKDGWEGVVFSREYIAARKVSEERLDGEIDRIIQYIASLG